MLEKSNIQTIDFGTLYKEQKNRSTFKPKSSHDWDKKAPSMNQRAFKSIYIEQFLEKIETKNVKTVLDIGCGLGTLSINLAKKVEHVYALDFSSKMLEFTNINAKNENLNNITTIQKSFEQPWDNVPKCDILLASRCMEVANLEEIMQKISLYAKKVYITYKVGGSFVDEDIINALERNITPKPDYIYLINILYNLGFMPKVDFIQSEGNRFQAFSKEEFLQKVTWSLGEISEKEKENLIQLYENKYRSKNFEKSRYLWAFISFETKKSSDDINIQ